MTKQPSPPPVPDAARVRGRPSQPFNWIDPRPVKDGYIHKCQSSQSPALYLVLVTVSNQQGISYYGDRRLCIMLNLKNYQLRQARHELIEANLIAYQKPYYQVLNLQPHTIPNPERPKPTVAEPQQHLSDLSETEQQTAAKQLQEFRENLRRSTH